MSALDFIYYFSDSVAGVGLYRGFSLHTGMSFLCEIWYDLFFLCLLLMLAFSLFYTFSLNNGIRVRLV